MELNDLRESAALARISMSDEDLKQMFPVFEQMVSFFGVMRDSGGTALPAPMVNASSGWLRPDTVSAAEDGVFETMLEQSPEHDGRFIVIPNVL